MTDTAKTPSAGIPDLPDTRDLPAMLTIPTAAALLGISRATGYRLAAADNLPVPIIPVGNSLRVPTAPLPALLGLTPGPGAATAADSGADAPGAGPVAAPADTGPDGCGATSDQDAQRDGLSGPGPTSGDGKTSTR